MSQTCPLCGGPHSLSSCPRWRVVSRPAHPAPTPPPAKL